MPSVAELLARARRRSFVGREPEIKLFENLLDAPHPECVLMYVYGPGGQGKTTLTKHFTAICEERQLRTLHVDAREVEPHPASFREAVKNSLGTHVYAGQDVFEALAALNGPTVMFIDTYEKITPIDDWVRTDFLPQLPANLLTVICGRSAPSLAWMTDSGWKALMRVVQLNNFSAAESAEYLRRRNIPNDKIAPILEFTHGHPLALSVVADIYEQFPDKNFNPDESPDVIRTLLQLFVRQVPSPMHRAALEVCALVNLLTESLLAEVMGLKDASELFSWMCGLSFISIGREGIYPHDITREALNADLKWRHPDWNAELHGRIRHYYHRKIKESSGEQQRRVLFDLIYLHRVSPAVKPFFDWQEGGSFWVDTAQESDLEVLRDMVRRHEGTESLRAFEYWQTHPAAQIWVWRDGAKQANAFVLKINAHQLADEPVPADPAVQALAQHIRKTQHLRSGEQAVIFRMWMANETHQQVSALQSNMFLTIVQFYFTPGLALSYIAVIQPEYWKAVFNYGDLYLAPGLDFEVNGAPYGWYTHDWRVRPPLMWLDLLGKKEVGLTVEEDAKSTKNQVVVLSEAGFTEGVFEALRNLHNNNLLLHNPLLRARMNVHGTPSDITEAELIAKLKEKLLTCIKDIEASPVDGKYHRVLYRTFVNPVGSQEKTADFLNMSFSTYRRYLASGVQRAAEMLWAEEVG